MKASSPIKPMAAVPPSSADTDPYADTYGDLPVARPVGHHYLPPTADPTNDSFLRAAVRLGIFHALNAVLSELGFVLVVVGSVFSLLLLPLCCFGIVTFRFVLFLVGLLAEFDVQLYNFISPPTEHVYVSVPRQRNVLEFSGLRLAPNLSSFSHGAVLVAVYFATVKFVVGLLSSVALSVAFSLPLSALTDASTQDTFFSGLFGILGFFALSALLLVIGAALMKFAAKLSRASTRFFCCEKFSTYQYVKRANAYPTAVPTYGATAPVDHGSDRIIV